MQTSNILLRLFGNFDRFGVNLRQGALSAFGMKQSLGGERSGPEAIFGCQVRQPVT